MPGTVLDGEVITMIEISSHLCGAQNSGEETHAHEFLPTVSSLWALVESKLKVNGRITERHYSN